MSSHNESFFVTKKNVQWETSHTYKSVLLRAGLGNRFHFRRQQVTDDTEVDRDNNTEQQLSTGKSSSTYGKPSTTQWRLFSHQIFKYVRSRKSHMPIQNPQFWAWS